MKGRSVPAWRVTRYSSGPSCWRHSASVLMTLRSEAGLPVLARLSTSGQFSMMIYLTDDSGTVKRLRNRAALRASARGGRATGGWRRNWPPGIARVKSAKFDSASGPAGARAPERAGPCAPAPSSPCSSAVRHTGPRWRRSPMGAGRADSRRRRWSPPGTRKRSEWLPYSNGRPRWNPQRPSDRLGSREFCWSCACERAQRRTTCGSALLLGRIVSGGWWRGGSAGRRGAWAEDAGRRAIARLVDRLGFPGIARRNFARGVLAHGCEGISRRPSPFPRRRSRRRARRCAARTPPSPRGSIRARSIAIAFRGTQPSAWGATVTITVAGVELQRSDNLQALPKGVILCRIPVRLGAAPQPDRVLQRPATAKGEGALHVLASAPAHFAQGGAARRWPRAYSKSSPWPMTSARLGNAGRIISHTGCQTAIRPREFGDP